MKSLELSVSPRDLSLAPGASALAEIIIANRSDAPQEQSLRVEGLDPSWITVPSLNTAAQPGEQRSFSLAVQCPPTAAAGRYTFNVIAESANDTERAVCSLSVVNETAPSAPAEVALGIDLRPRVVEIASEDRDGTELTATVRNLSAVESELVLTVLGVPADWLTYPARIRVAAGESIDIKIGVLPAAGVPSASFPITVEAYSERAAEARARAESSLVLLPPTPDIQEAAPAVSVGGKAPLPPVLTMDPLQTRFEGALATEQATVTVVNRSRLIEQLDLEVIGLPDGWYRLSGSSVTLDPDQTQQVMLFLTPHPGAEAPAGEYHFVVRAEPKSSPGTYAEIGAMLSVIGVPRFDAKLAPLQSSGRREEHKLYLRNTGTVPLSLLAEATDPTGNLQFRHPAPPNLEPGEERVLRVGVGAARNRFVGSREPYEFSLRVGPAGGESTQDKAFNGRFVHQPYLGSRIFKSSLWLALIAVLVGMLFVIGPPRLWDGLTWSFDRVECAFDADELARDPTGAVLRDSNGSSLTATRPQCLTGEAARALQARSADHISLELVALTEARAPEALSSAQSVRS